MSGQGADDYDRWMYRAIKAFPPRWRDEHAAEFLEVSRELSPTGSDRRAASLQLFDVVRGGLTVRLRDRPPLWRRLLYHWAWQPVPRQYWGWMRDGLSSRSLGLRVQFRGLLGFWAVIAVLWSTGTTVDQQGLALVAAVMVVATALGARRQARAFRARIHMRIGFDLTTWGVVKPVDGVAPTFPELPAPPPPPPPPRVPSPNRRTPIRLFVWPLACWGLISGVAFIVGAALPNLSFSFGSFTYAPDPNSPLSATEVGQWSVALAGVSALLIATMVVVGLIRSRTLAHKTAHPVNALTAETRQTFWALASICGVPAIIIGLSGVMPDLACVVVGSALVLGGVGLAGLGLMARTVEPGLGRPLSVNDLLAGERWSRRWGGLTPGTVIDVAKDTHTPLGRSVSGP